MCRETENVESIWSRAADEEEGVQSRGLESKLRCAVRWKSSALGDAVIL